MLKSVLLLLLAIASSSLVAAQMCPAVIPQCQPCAAGQRCYTIPKDNTHPCPTAQCFTPGQQPSTASLLDTNGTVAAPTTSPNTTTPVDAGTTTNTTTNATATITPGASTTTAASSNAQAAIHLSCVAVLVAAAIAAL